MTNWLSAFFGNIMLIKSPRLMKNHLVLYFSLQCTRHKKCAPFLHFKECSYGPWYWNILTPDQNMCLMPRGLQAFISGTNQWHRQCHRSLQTKVTWGGPPIICVIASQQNSTYQCLTLWMHWKWLKNTHIAVRWRTATKGKRVLGQEEGVCVTSTPSVSMNGPD